MEENNNNWPGNKRIVVVDDMSKEEMEHLAKEHEQALEQGREVGFWENSRERIISFIALEA